MKKRNSSVIYFDNAAYAPPLERTKRIFEIVLNAGANPNSAHAKGQIASRAIEVARERMARWLHCHPDEIIFTSGATESCNLALACMASACEEIVHLDIANEHAATKTRSRLIEAEVSRTGKTANGRRGYICNLANSETGAVAVPALWTRNKRDLLFVDATAAVGSIAVDFKNIGADYLAAGASKFGGIPGVGFLIVRRGAPRCPLIVGGENGNFDLRGGTEPAALIAAMAEALRMTRSARGLIQRMIVEKRDFLISALLEEIEGAKLNGPWTAGAWGDRLPGNVNIMIPGVEAAALVNLLSANGIMCSAGSACKSGTDEPSEALLKLGLTTEQAKSSVRFSLWLQNSMEEAKRAVPIIARCVKELREA